MQCTLYYNWAVIQQIQYILEKAQFKSKHKAILYIHEKISAIEKLILQNFSALEKLIL